MFPKTIRFHEVHGKNIRLSSDGMEAELESLGDGLCFTNRPLVRGENLILNLSALSAARNADLRVGVTRSDPSSMSFRLPSYLISGVDQTTGFRGTNLLTYGDCLRLHQELAIYFDENNGDLMIQNVGSEPRVLFPAAAVNGPVYIILNLLEHSRNVRISSRRRIDRQTVIGVPGGHLRQETERSRRCGLDPAYFASTLPFKIHVCPLVARSDDHSLSRMSFAFVDTLLRPKSTLIVKLTELKQITPLQIVLTTEDAAYAYSFGYLSALCDNSYSLPLESDMPSVGDELAIRISSTGAVSIAHNDRDWLQRIHVDPLLGYHVVFSLQHISVLTMIGVKSEIEEVDENQTDCTEALTRENRKQDSSACIVCLENSRTVVLIPCFHFALCEGCARSIQQTDDARCPVCRASLIDVKKIYAV